MNKAIIIIGGGPAGYKLALELRRLAPQEEIILIEKNKLGGACLHRGCIPSKFLHATNSLDKLASQLHKHQLLLEKGIEAELREAKVSVIIDEATCDLSNPDHPVVIISGQSYEASKLIIATGSQPASLDPNLLPTGFRIHNTDTLFSPENLNRGLAPAYSFIGGGYIGVELASILAHHGIRTRIIEAQDKILGFLDNFIHSKLMEELARQKIEVLVNQKNLLSIPYQEGEEIVVAIGRKAVSPQGLDKAPHLNSDKIFFIGDISSELNLAHYAYAQARLLAKHLTGSPSQTSIPKHLVAQVIFSKPEVAYLGYTELEAKQLYPNDVDTIIVPWTKSGKARLEGKERGYNKIIIKSSTGQIIGIHMIGHGASELISVALGIIKQGSTIEDLRSWIFPHPTLAELFSF